METKRKIRGFVAKFMDVGDVGDGDNFFEKGMVNSLFAMQLVNFVEKEFEIGIDDDELDIENFKSIDCIAALIESKT